MKKLCAILLTFVLALSIFAACDNSEGPAGTTINVYNWGQYISDGTDGYVDVNAAFTEATGIEVNYMTFDSNESLYTKLKAGGSTYDVIIPSDYMVARLIAEGMLEPLDFSNIPNYGYVDDAYKNTAYDPNNLYSVPYTWGSVGIIYNTKYVDEVTSWNALWDEKYSGKILMFDNPRDAFAIAEFLNGDDVNSEDEAVLNAAAERLMAQKPFVQSYVMDQIYAKMEREEAWIAPYYAGDYLQMVQENENLAFAFPEEGFNIFIDAMCIPKDCQNKAAAEAYINFLCSPEISGQNLEYLGYSTPISAAKEYMDPEVAENEIAYPDAETLERGRSFLSLNASATQLMDSLWLEVKTTGSGSLLPAIIITVVILGVAAFFILRASAAKKRRARRGKA
ncbi:MAG TPA: spermidine/putrescine ABC transporter substrate-binding protein [Clostridia bacterium]|nr:MAG: Spermidine/putrescine-binding periplasmic protein precursor [Firmicutes bacterium ADurb.Bin248]HOG01464.1 spermidine/putrescine ABC transporter substrate-binding protein [Clostridia bacterium]HOS19090.1 spermidine/putrescine ABC transporter substrate-binding protein [Clostridia bacterium]